MPAINPITSDINIMMATGIGEKIVAGLRCFPVRLLYSGIRASTSIKAITRLVKLIITDSKRNWVMSDFLSEPKVLRIPTSLALSADLAVDRLIKLIHAITRMNKAMSRKIATAFSFPLGLSSPSRFEFK